MQLHIHSHRSSRSTHEIEYTYKLISYKCILVYEYTKMQASLLFKEENSHLNPC